MESTRGPNLFVWQIKCYQQGATQLVSLNQSDKADKKNPHPSQNFEISFYF